MVEKSNLDTRKANAVSFLRSPKVIFPIILILLIILGVYIRTLPMTPHGQTPGLWDHSRNDWTLGPDLDPWSFVKNAKIIADNGSLPATDTLRNVPLGVDNSRETILLPYMIYGTYLVANLFDDFSMEFAGVLFPVIMFALTIIIFFLFVREIFVSNNKTKANLIASISTFFFIVIPSLLPRTIAGIPEKESIGFLFMFLAFYLFLKSIKSNNLRGSIFWGVLAGIATALMRFVWGGAVYIFGAIFIAILLVFLFNKINKKSYATYTSWMIAAFFVMVSFSGWFTISSLFALSYTSSCIALWFLLTLHMVIWNTKISNNSILNRLNKKIPKNIISILISLAVIIPISLIIFGPNFVYEKLQAIYELLFNPITGRWNTTVAENRPPYLREWLGNFGPYIGKVPLMFALFFTGAIVLFKEAFNSLKKKDSVRLTIAYSVLLIGIIFSRLSPMSIFNGQNFISQLLFIGSIVFFLFLLISYSIKYAKENNDGFKKIKFEYILLISLFVLCLFTVRGAIRLTMVLASVVPIFVGYLIVKLVYAVKADGPDISGQRDEDDIGLARILSLFLLAIVLISSIFTGYTFYQTSTAHSYNMVPNYYNIQWQNAMDWVRDTTPTDAVFAHWWDYGYWIQAMGERATVTDGGNVITYWNYLMGRHVLTGDNQEDALEFLYNHEADYLLIDSTDIGKYGAYSSIGSDKDYDRFSTVSTMLLDPQQIHETADSVTYFYKGGMGLDEDIAYKTNETSYFFPQSQSAIYGVSVTINNNTIKNIDIIIFNKGSITSIPLRYAQNEYGYYDTGIGLNGTVKIIPRIDNLGNMYPDGALLYISPRVSKTLFSHLYLLDDPVNKFNNFELSRVEPNILTQDNKIFYYDPVGIVGPIKIWSIIYSGSEKLKQEYIDTDSTKYLDWKL